MKLHRRPSLRLRWLLPALVSIMSNTWAGPRITVETPLSWLQPVAGTDARFASLAAQAVGQNALAQIQPLLPYCIAVTNTGTVAVIGLAVRFNIVTGAKTVTRDYFYYGFKPKDAPVVAPGQTRLFTPLRSANNLVHGRPAPPANGSSLASVLGLLSFADSIDVALDLVIAPDGRTAGADQGQHVSQMRAHSEAFHAMTSEAMNRITAGVSDADLSAWLQSVAANQAPDRYTSAQKQLATQWINMISSGQRSSLVASLTRATTLPDLSQQFLGTLKGGLQ